ncbi:HelD family protein [Solicola gregarius]|uniref:ATP-binding domain-containing protein n=1 Tax=Solicola gregarius TaxID=2908642 RepID=A0AA46YNI4_9ACTN|nr:ATP-binding domain-containing protein [Solicola gregarius]UYM06733.1 ATP-binding domain-containing protein [Solicola gregarius]
MGDLPDPELASERNHLQDSRKRLAQMRAKVEGLSAIGGDAVSTEYLKAALWQRMRALEDDPTVPLFFGRLDYTAANERLYIGRRHVTDDIGDPMVIDWRASMSRPFYRASKQEPMGVGLRRRFGFDHGELTAYEDEHLDRGDDGVTGQILRDEIERPRAGPMRDIVATIQPEQDDIVRSDISTSVCVQGAPGTGKTAVGLHRAAYLLYAFRDQLSRQGVLVVGPNASFLRYIGDVLPALGEIEATQTTVPDLVGRVRIRGVDAPAAAAVKTDARMAEVIAEACWSHLRPPQDALVVPRGSRRWRVPAYEVGEMLDELRARGVRYAAGRSMLAQRIAHAVLLKMEAAGDSPDDRVQDAVARSAPVRKYVDATWPRLQPEKVVHRLLSEPQFLERCAADVLTADERATVIWSKPPRSAGVARWTVHDAVLIDEAADVIDRTPSRGHVVLDEAQDLSPMMLRAVGRRASTGSVTVLGDLAQATTPWGSRDWATSLAHLGKRDTVVDELSQGFRVPSDVIGFAARLLPQIAPDLAPPTSVREASGSLVALAGDDAYVLACDAVARLIDELGSVGVIVADAQHDAMAKALDAHSLTYSRIGADDDMSAHVDLVPASLVKGLEFDHVVLVEPQAVVDDEDDHVTGLRRLYVCLTRAVTSLTVTHARPLPELLR